MKKPIFLVSLLIFGLFLCGAAAAIPMVGDLSIDFRTAAWSSAYNMESYTVGNVTATAFDKYLVPGKLYQDGKDGLGVLGGEDDEIDAWEFLQLHIEGGMALTGVWLTDLFKGPDGTDGGPEEGALFLDTTGDGKRNRPFTFAGVEPQGTTNGELFFDFGGDLTVYNAWFTTNPYPGGDNNEYSVAGFTAVPEPATMLLLGIGLIGLAGFGKKKFKQSA